MKTFIVRTTIEAKLQANDEDDAIVRYQDDWLVGEAVTSESYRVEAFEVHPEFSLSS